MSQYLPSTIEGFPLKISRLEGADAGVFQLDPRLPPEDHSLALCPQDVSNHCQDVKVVPRQSPEYNGRINRSLKME